LRSLIEQLSLEDFVEQCHAQTKLPRELLRDTALELLAAMLMKEAQYKESFPSVGAFVMYLRKATIRKAIVSHKRDQRHHSSDGYEWVSDALNPEEQVLRALESHSFSQLVEDMLEQTDKDDPFLQDVHTLIKLICSAPERFIHRRQSGKNKGALVFHFVELQAALQWSKHRVFERVERVQKLFMDAVRKERAA
jgi:hypothetical protein